MSLRPCRQAAQQQPAPQQYGHYHERYRHTSPSPVVPVVDHYVARGVRRAPLGILAVRLCGICVSRPEEKRYGCFRRAGDLSGMLGESDGEGMQKPDGESFPIRLFHTLRSCGRSATKQARDTTAKIRRQIGSAVVASLIHQILQSSRKRGILRLLGECRTAVAAG